MVVIFFSKRAQFKIQQMAFMLVALFVFFILVGLFFLQMSLGDLRYSAQQLEREQVMSAIHSWSELPEFSCSDGSSNCIDEDKIYIMGSEDYNRLYSSFWPVGSIRIYRVNTNSSNRIRCPKLDCNYYNIYGDSETNLREYGGYVSICRTLRKNNAILKECEMGVMAIGVKNV